MEHIAAYVNDTEHAQAILLPLMTSQRSPTGWTIVICTPRLTRHIGRFAAQRSRRQWREQWAERLRLDMEPRLREQVGAERLTWLTAEGPLVELTQRMRRQHGESMRVLDARQSRLGASLLPVSSEQLVQEPGKRLVAPVAVSSALSLVLALAD